MWAAVAATSASRQKVGRSMPGISLNDDDTPQATISRLSAWMPISATAASIDAIERWPPKNDEFARRSTLALSTGSCESASPILRASTSGSRSAAISRWTTRGIVGSSTLPAAMSLMKLGARRASAGSGSRLALHRLERERRHVARVVAFGSALSRSSLGASRAVSRRIAIFVRQPRG